MKKGPTPYHRATPRDPQTFTREVAERVAEEMTRDTGIKHIAQPWKLVGREIAYVIGRKITPEEATRIVPSPGSDVPSEPASSKAGLIRP